MVVVDASITVAWFLPSPNADAQYALEQTVARGALLPALWRWEVQNVLRKLQRNQRLTRSPHHLCQTLLELPLTIDNALGLFGAEAELAAEYNLTIYDAAYLELALRKKLQLATNDKALRHAAIACKCLLSSR